MKKTFFLLCALLLVLGLTPGLTMEPLAQWAGRFLRADPGHSVHYFESWVVQNFICLLYTSPSPRDS